VALRDPGDQLIGEEGQAFMFLAFGAQVGNVMRHHRRHGTTVRGIGCFIDDVLQHGDGQLRRYRVGDRQPYAVAERSQ
jgi:hypothetical protein